MAITRAHPRMARRGWQVVTVMPVSFAAVPGTAVRRASARPIRDQGSTEYRINDAGFRVGRTLTP